MTLKRRSVPSSDNNNTSSVVSENLVNGQEYEGRLVYVADLGLRERSFKGEVKDPAQQIALGIEIIGEEVEFEDGTKKPKVLFTNPMYIYPTMDERGKEYTHYKIFEPTAESDTVPDWEKQLGKPCSVTIKHGRKDGKVYDNIGSLAGIPKKYQDSVGEAVTEPCIGDADDTENACTKALFGLVRWAWNRRLNEEAITNINSSQESLDDYSGDVPF